MNLKTRLTQHLALAAVATAAVSSANAQIVHSGIVNLAVPATTNGLYLNVVTGANNLPTSSAGSTVPGWDINPWSSTGFGLFNPSSPVGGVYVVSSAGNGANMAFAAIISGASLFGSSSTTSISQWTLNSDQNLVGFRFFNEGNGQVHYGWARFAFGSSITSRSLVEYAYDATPGASIGAGVIPAPSAVALLGLGGMVAGRRRR